jgi:superoxide dismutase, Fe-Mn family
MGKYTLPDLPYDYSALEPHIDARTMEIHHTKHHQTYVDKLNGAIESTDLADKYPDVDDLVRNIGEISDETTKKMVRNHGGGHSNHSIFWTIMSADGGGEPSGDIASALDDAFGSFKEFREKFTTAATNHFGSGWAWLASKSGKLDVITCLNQDSPFMDGYDPIFGIDVWEHAYYLKYQNKRPDYIEAWWNVVNWNEVNNRLKAAQ